MVLNTHLPPAKAFCAEPETCAGATTSTIPSSMNYDGGLGISSESYELNSEIAYDVKSVTNNLILFTGSESHDGLAALQAILQGERESPRAAFPVTTDVFRWTEAFWVQHSLQ